MTQDIYEGAGSGDVMGFRFGPRQPNACEHKASGQNGGTKQDGWNGEGGEGEYRYGGGNRQYKKQ